MRLCLVSMPWLATDTPSLALGILRRRVADECPAVEVDEYHGTLRWPEYLLRRTGGEVTPARCAEIGDKGLLSGLGDWIFAGPLYGRPDWRLAELRDRARVADIPLALAELMRELADDYVESAADEILAGQPDVVAFTTTFMQTVASLAVARRIKARSPGVRIVFGGANCDGSMGAAVHRNHRFVDFVVRGEGEITFPVLLDRIAADRTPADMGGVCWWDGERPVANPESHQLVPPATYALPDYDEWFRILDGSEVREYVTPFLFVEGSRGCWWGERHQCTFCGLNPATIAYRSKPAQRFWDELSYLVHRYRVLDVMTADNIMDMSYYRELMPVLTASGWDLRLQFEAKANVTGEHIAALAGAGVVAVQFGIESLASSTLKIMDKGVTGTANVRVLRDCETYSLTAQWNYLYGFPGESESDYRPVIDQIPALVHLQPPGNAGRILLERFNPYFERPELGFERREPLPFYRDVYDLPAEEIADIAYYFDSDDRGIRGAIEVELIDAVDRWRRDHPTSSLFSVPTADTLTVYDRRAGWPVRDHELTGWRRAAYEGLDRGRTPESLGRLLTERGHDVSDHDVRAWLRECLVDGLVYADAGAYVALATGDVPVRVVRRSEQAVAA